MIRRIPAAEIERGFRSLETGKPPFHLRKGRALSAQQPGGRCAAAFLQHGVGHVLFQQGMIRQPEIVVGRKVDSGGGLKASSQPGRYPVPGLRRWIRSSNWEMTTPISP